MEFQRGDSGSSGGGNLFIEDNGGNDIQNGPQNKHRHTPEQIQRLEAFYKECPHPDLRQRLQLGVELDLDPRQIKFWFQNKRNQEKVHREQAENESLRVEIDRIRTENISMLETLKTAICVSCEGPCSSEEERKQNLQLENTELKLEYERQCNILAKYMSRSVPGAAFDVQDPSFSGQLSDNPVLDDSLMENFNADNLGLAYQMDANEEREKSYMYVLAASAMNELRELLKQDHPFWTKNVTNDQYILDQDNYQQITSQSLRLKYPNSRKELSKHYGVVALSARSLVDVYLNPDKWSGFFPSMVSKARTIDVIEAGLLGNRGGSLQLVYEQLRILTPLVQRREFYVLRYCQQIDTGIWVIVDISYDYLNGSSHDFPICCWKYPSGCMIHEMPNGLSVVTYIQHVEVDSSLQVHPIYDDLVKSALGFGARRWIMTLQKTFEHDSFLTEAWRPWHGVAGVNASPAGTESMIMLACRMVKNYCSIFSLSGSSDSHQLPTTNGVQIVVRQNSCPGQPAGIVISAATSFWVPATIEAAFKYLRNHMMRSQWEIPCNGNSVHELTQIPTGSDPAKNYVREVMQIPTGSDSANCISVLQPLNSSESIMILQESMVDPLESYIVYAPIEAPTMEKVAFGMDSNSIPILASGFSLTTDGVDRSAASSSSNTRIPGSGGSLLTVAFQYLACSSSSFEDVGEDVITMINGFVTNTIHVIKSNLDPSD